MEAMFSSADDASTPMEFNQDISAWNTSSVTNMSSLFDGCCRFNHDISAWDITSVTSMTAMFGVCTSLDCDLSSWDLSNIDAENRIAMFSGALTFHRAPERVPPGTDLEADQQIWEDFLQEVSTYTGPR